MTTWIRIEGGRSGLKSFEIGKYPVTVQEFARSSLPAPSRTRDGGPQALWRE